MSISKLGAATVQQTRPAVAAGSAATVPADEILVVGRALASALCGHSGAGPADVEYQAKALARVLEGVDARARGASLPQETLLWLAQLGEQALNAPRKDNPGRLGLMAGLDIHERAHTLIEAEATRAARANPATAEAFAVLDQLGAPTVRATQDGKSYYVNLPGVDLMTSGQAMTPVAGYFRTPAEAVVETAERLTELGQGVGVRDATTGQLKVVAWNEEHARFDDATYQAATNHWFTKDPLA